MDSDNLTRPPIISVTSALVRIVSLTSTLSILKENRLKLIARSLTLAALLGIASVAHAQTIPAPYSANYTLTDLGSVAGLPTSYGGLTLKAGDSNTLLVGGHANASNGGIYAVSVVRDGSSHITGFSGSASLFASAPRIDGGLAYGPGGVLFYTTYSSNTIGEIMPGSSSPDKIVSLTGLGVSSSVGSLNFVPNGFGGAGRMKILSYSAGLQYDATLSPDGSGTYNIDNTTLKANQGGGPEGIVYIKGGNPNFGVDSALVADYSAGAVIAYNVDANGDLMTGTAQNFITGLGGAEGAFIDPITGDFLFSTFGGNNSIIAVRGFAPPPAGGVPEPGSVALLVGMASVSGFALRRRKK